MSEPSPQMPQLVEIDGPNVGRTHPLPYGTHVAGRGARAGIRLDHEDVSREHAVVEVGPEGMLIRDADSKNGVWAGGRRIEQPVLLCHDDRFSLGDLSLRVIHPASQVTRALAAGGETTVTTDHPPVTPQPALRGLLFPLLGILLFGTLVAVMLLR